jgi:hypothetical protein
VFSWFTVLGISPIFRFVACERDITWLDSALTTSKLLFDGQSAECRIFSCPLQTIGVDYHDSRANLRTDYSADVRLYLLVGNQAGNLAKIGPDSIMLREPGGVSPRRRCQIEAAAQSRNS